MTPGVVSYLGVSGILFCIGLAGVLLRRNPLIVLLSLEVMLNSVNLSLVAFSLEPTRSPVAARMQFSF